MVALASLLGVALGAVIAAGTQLAIRRSQRRERWMGDLLEQCATVYALEAKFRGAANAAYDDSVAGRLRAWPRDDRRLCEAKILLLCDDDDELQASLSHLSEVGRKTYEAALVRTPDYEGLKQEHRNAMEDFASAARRALRDQHAV
jgi:hypothetical protein